MKQRLILSGFIAALSCSVAAPTYSAVVSGDPNSSRTNTAIIATNQYVIARSGDGQTWESVRSLTNIADSVTYQTNHVQELATGMHYFDGTAWQPSDPSFAET